MDILLAKSESEEFLTYKYLSMFKDLSTCVSTGAYGNYADTFYINRYEVSGDQTTFKNEFKTLEYLTCEFYNINTKTRVETWERYIQFTENTKYIIYINYISKSLDVISYTGELYLSLSNEITLKDPQFDIHVQFIKDNNSVKLFSVYGHELIVNDKFVGPAEAGEKSKASFKPIKSYCNIL